jgi:hypothetical protein
LVVLIVDQQWPSTPQPVVIIFHAIIVWRPTATIFESPICGGPPPFLLSSIARGDEDHIPPSLSLPICYIKGIIIVDASLLTH